ncbi:MAG: 30S ribosomal protein S4 [Candidatus Omnitrophota bacterium]
MARVLESKCKACRREGAKLFLKGVRCNTEKCAFVKRPRGPGQHVRRVTKKTSYYAQQLREKQKVKRIYGVLDRQFKRFFKLASKSKGVTGKMLVQILERRLDNVLYRSLFSLSRSQARQLVLHGFVFVDSKRVNIPSFFVKEGQVIELKGKTSMISDVKGNIEINTKERSVPSWINIDKDKLKISVLRLPQKDDLTIAINEQLIVELYSK